MSLDESVIYELIASINQLKLEIKNLREELKDTQKSIKENTFELMKQN